MIDLTSPYKHTAWHLLMLFTVQLALNCFLPAVVTASEIDSDLAPKISSTAQTSSPTLQSEESYSDSEELQLTIDTEKKTEGRHKFEKPELDLAAPMRESDPQVSANENEIPIISRDSFNSSFLGHNVTPTANLLKKGVATVGPYIIAFAPCQHVILASSPWIHFGYNMINLHLKTGFELNRNEKVAFMASYFKTYNEERSATYIDAVGDRTDYTYLLYKQHSTTYSLLYSNKISSIYSIHTALSYLYFFDDTHPYSLHMESFKPDKHEWIVSALHETRLMNNFGINVETGLLGLNYRYPYLHYGVSFTYVDRDWLIQLGMSHTMPTSGAHDRIDLENYRPTDAVHPEIQLQRFF